MPYKAENWHALSHQQYFLRHGFVDIGRCALNITQTSLVDTKDESDRHPENIRQKFTKSSKLGIPMENLKTSFFNSLVQLSKLLFGDVRLDVRFQS